MAWFLLVVAGVVEIVWALSLKASHGFTRLVPSVVSLMAAVGTISLLSHVMKTLPAGTAYAAWTAIGTIGVALFGIVIYGESSDWKRLLCIALILVGAIGLRLLPTK